VSCLYTDVSELVFDRCAPGKRHVKDFAVWNSSEIETWFHVSLADPTRAESLQLYDYETGDRIVRDRVEVAPFGNHRVVVAFVAKDEDVPPSSSAPVVMWLAVENVRDPLNVSYVKVSTFTTNEVAGAGLEFSCGDTLSFGDCYSHEPVQRVIELRNTLRSPLSISLSSTLLNEVAFEVVPAAKLARRESRARTSAGVTTAGMLNAKAEKARGDAESELRFDDSVDDAAEAVDGSGASSESEEKDTHDSANKDDGPGERPHQTKRLAFQPGEDIAIRVWYTPGRSPGQADAGRLCRRTFQLVFGQSATESRLVAAEARVCESIVTLGSHRLNMGDCDVLKAFNASVTLFNLSDLPAHIFVECESKCITPGVESVRVEARQSFDLGLVFVPITLNPDYAKEIKFVNLHNRRRGPAAVTLTANNVDRRCISLHAVFYKVLDPGLTNEINFGRIASNYPAIRVFRFQNVSTRNLVLGFDDTEGVTSFAPRWNVRKREGASDMHRISSAQESLSPSISGGSTALSTRGALDGAAGVFTREMSSPRMSSFSISRTIMSLLDADMLTTLKSGDGSGDSSAITLEPQVGQSRMSVRVDSHDLASFVANAEVVECLPDEDDLDVAKVSSGRCNGREDLMRQWIETDFVPLSLQTSNVLSGMAEESKWAEEQLRPGQRLVHYVNNGALVRANHLVLGPGEESVLCVAVAVGDRSVSRRATELSLRVRLVEFDSSRLQRRAKACAWRGAMFADTSFENPPLREVMLSVQICRSPVKIRPLQTLNFGVMTAGMQKHRHFYIDNSDSNACLIFSIRKTRSVASDDVRLGNGYDSGRLGVVRPHAVATIPFVFRPTLSGPFREEVVVSNSMDMSASQTLTVKATVLKRWNFHVLTQSQTDFGTLECGTESVHVLRLDVHNDTDKPRKFSISVIDRRRSSASVPLPKILFDVTRKIDPADKGDVVFSGRSAEIQAKEGKLEHYLKKGKAAKAEALKKEIAVLKEGAPAKSVASIVDQALPSDSISFLDSPSTLNSSARRSEQTPAENYCAFDVAGGRMSSVEVTLFVDGSIGKSQPVATRGDISSALHHIRGRSLLESAELSASGEQLDNLGMPKPGHFKFTLGVFETKNRDTCHSINCTTFVTTPIRRSESTLDASELFIPRKNFPASPPARGIVAATAPAAASAASAAASAAARAIGPLGSIRPYAGKGAQELERHSSDDSKMPLPQVDFGNLQLGVAVRRSIQIRNTSGRYADYVSIVPNTCDGTDAPKSDDSAPKRDMQTTVEVFGFDKAVAPGQLHTFFVSFIALVTGAHARTLILKPRVATSNDEEAHRLILTAFCVKGEIVCLREGLPHSSSTLNRSSASHSLSDPGTDLDFGHGVVDPARDFAIVKAVHALSLVDVDVLLTVRSNLSQVMPFQDADLKIPAENIVIQARDSIQLWVAVAPRLRKSEIRDGVVRRLVGGLQLCTWSADGNRMVESTVRFSASVGASHFSVTPRFVDLGVCPKPDPPCTSVLLSGTMVLQNQSVGTESRFLVECKSDLLVFESPLEGVLGPRESTVTQAVSDQHLDSSRSSSQKSFHEVRFQLTCKRRGFIRDEIVVKNLLSPSLSHYVPVRAFVDAGILKGSLDGVSHGIAAIQVYLSVSDKVWVVCHGGRHIWSLASSESVGELSGMFLPMSNLLLHVQCAPGDVSEWESALTVDSFLAHSDGTFGGSDGPYRDCGKEFVLNSDLGSSSLGRDLVVEVLAPTRLSSRNESILRSGQNLTIEGGLLLRQCVATSIDEDSSGVTLQQIRLSYCLSQLQFGAVGVQAEIYGKEKKDDDSGSSASPAPPVSTCVTDIGDIGHCSAWRDENAMVTISNPCSSVLEFGIEHVPPGFSLEQVGDAKRGDAELCDADDASNSSTSRWYRLHPEESVVIRLRIHPAKVKLNLNGETDGRLRAQVNIVNRMNPSGGLIWTIAGRLTSPRLKFDGLDKLPRSAAASQPRVSLPDFYLPGTTSSSTTFRVKNVSETRVALGIGFEKRSPTATNLEASALLELLDVDLSEGVSGVDLRSATLNPGEVLGIRVTAVPQSHESERSILKTVFSSTGSIERVVGVVRFACTVAGTTEPSEMVEVRLACKRGEAIVVDPKELSLSGFVPRELVVLTDEKAGNFAYDDPDSNLQTVTISNRLGQTNLNVSMKLVGVPAGTTPVLIPQSAWIEASSTLEIRVGLIRNASARASLYGSATLLIFDEATSAEGGACLSRDADPIASVELHVNTNENEEEDTRCSSGRSTKFDLAEVTEAVVSGAGSSGLSDKAGLETLSPPPPSPSSKPEYSYVASPSVLLENAVQSHVLSLLPHSGGGWANPVTLVSTHPTPLEARLQIGTLSRSDSGASQFALKGCAQVVGDLNRFELNCGQFSPSSEPYVRRLTLENRSNVPIEYKCIRIRPRNSALDIGSADVRAQEEVWLTISRSGGVLAPSGERGGSQTLVLTMQRDHVNVYSAYLVFEAGDGCEVKTVRLLMEVVADGATPGIADSYFSMLCDGRGADSRFIDFGTIMLGQLYRHRSFVIRNNSNVTLEFMLSSDLPEASRSELTFSLTNAVLRKTSRVIVPPKARRRVFLLYRPMWEPSDPPETDLEAKRVFNVRVTCRLVKDYQGNIRIISECRPPSLQCSKTDFLFDCADLVHSIAAPSEGLTSVGAADSSDGAASQSVAHGLVARPEKLVRPDHGTLKIRNVSSRGPLVFCIRNPTRFFEVDCVGEVTLDASSDDESSRNMTVTLRPSIERIRERAQFLLREKYVEEHITVSFSLLPFLVGSRALYTHLVVVLGTNHFRTSHSRCLSF
jgi:hypothetical protein